MATKKKLLSDISFGFKEVTQVAVLAFAAAMWWFSHNQTIDTLKVGNEKVDQVYEKQEVQEETIEEINVRQMEVQTTVEGLYPKVDATLGVVKSQHGLAEFKVQAGQTFWEIAQILEIHPTTLKLYNKHIADINELDEGMIIFYPLPEEERLPSSHPIEDVPH